MNKYIPTEQLMKLPAPFVRELCELRIKEIEEMNKNQNDTASQINNNNISSIQDMIGNKEVVENLADELDV